MSGSARVVSVPPDIDAKYAFAVKLKCIEKKGYDEAPSIVMTSDAIIRHMDAFLVLEGSCPLLWESTSCFRRAGMFDSKTGASFRLAEGIGRHNCLDRLAGWACLGDIDPAETVLFVPVHVTFSLCARACRVNFPFFIGRSTITSTLVGMARQQNRLCPVHPVTVVGFCCPREERLTIFAGEGRIA